MSLAIAVRIAGSSVRSIARRGPATRRRAKVGDHVHRVGRRAAVAEREQRAAALERVARSSAAAGQRVSRVLGQRLRPQRADLLGLHQHRAPDVVEHLVEVVLALGQERVQEARGAGVVAAALGAPLEQPAVLEEHVHELPQHVVQRSRPAPGGCTDRRLGGSNSHSAPAARTRSSGSRGRARPATASAVSAIVLGRRRTRSTMSVGAREQLRPRRHAARRRRARSPAAPACRRSPGGRTRPRRGARRSGPPGERPNAISRPPRANRSAIRWQSRASRSASAPKNAAFASGAARARAQRFRARGAAHAVRASAFSRGATASSQSRHASTPSPVRALTSIRSTPGLTWSRW